MKLKNCLIIFVLCIFILIGCKEVTSTTSLTATKENTTTTIENNKSSITTSTSEKITTTNEDTPTTTTQEIITTTQEEITTTTQENITTEHIHEYSEWQITKNPTCIEDGIEERICSCGETETRTVDALGHNYSDWIIAEPTDTTNGYRYKECSGCDDVYIDLNYIIDSVSYLAFELSEDESYYIVSGVKGFNYNTVVIPKSYNDKPVKEIKSSAFYGCSSLNSVTIDDSVTSIGNSAFKNCYALKTINIPNSLEKISQSLFENCRSLKSISIPSNVMMIDNFAFYNDDSRLL